MELNGMLRAVSVKRAGAPDLQGHAPFDVAVLAHDERHLRRRVVTLSHGDKVLVDFPEPLALNDGDMLVLEDGRLAGIVAADEELLDIRGRDAVHLAELAWHIGNRHLAAAVRADRILILRDHVIKAMLEGLGAQVTEIFAPFAPLGGAYSGDGGPAHSHRHDGHGHAHRHGSGDDHHHHTHDDEHARHRPVAARHRHNG
jgi:urease accessory protein